MEAKLGEGKNYELPQNCRTSRNFLTNEEKYKSFLSTIYQASHQTKFGAIVMTQ